MGMFDLVRFDMQRPGIPKGEWFQTYDIEADTFGDSQYAITENGELHLLKHDAIDIKASLERSGLLHQYQRYWTVPTLGLQQEFCGKVELYGSVNFHVMIERGRVVMVSHPGRQPAP